MKNTNKGFIIPAMIALVLLVTLCGGTYVYLENKKVSNKNNEVPEAPKEQSSTSTSKAEANTTHPAKTLPTEAKKVELSASSTIKIAAAVTCTDSACFVNAINNCSPASYQVKNDTELLGSRIKSENAFSTSLSNGKCLLNLKLISYNISPSQGLLDSMKGAQMVGPSPEETYTKLNKETNDKYVGKKGVCNITNTKGDIIKLFKENNASWVTIFSDNKTCSGDLIIQ